MYKNILYKNIEYKEFSKKYSLYGNTFSDIKILEGYDGVLSAEKFDISKLDSNLNIDGSNKFLLYKSFKNTYNNHFINKSNYPTYINQYMFNINSIIKILSIPRKYFSHGIKLNSLYIKIGSLVELIDDASGNLLVKNTVTLDSVQYIANTCVGNVFYESGLILLNDAAGKIYNIFNSDISFYLEFESINYITMHTYKCQVLENEFNLSTHPMLLDSNNTYVEPFKTLTMNNEFKPYITTIGLYDDQNNLIAIGKLNYPIQNKKNINYIFTIKLDI